MPDFIFQSQAFSKLHKPSAQPPHHNAACAVAPASVAPAVIDADTFNALLSLCDVETTPEFLCEILEDFLADTVAQLTSLRRAVGSNDAGLMDQAAHALKASSSNVAAARMAELCLTLQVMGRSGRFDGAAEQLQQLENEFAKVREVFVSECQRRRDAFAARQ